MQQYIKDLAITREQDWQERLVFIAEKYPGETVFSTSFSIEDQIITHFIAENKLAIDFVTLDTGRLFEETHKLWQQTIDKYGIIINAYHPDKARLAAYVRHQGVNAFYQSQELRLECCRIRKVEPLKRALSGYKIWLADPLIALHVIAIAEIWKAIPFMPLFFLSGLQSLPSETFEAAAVDGANVFQRFFYILFRYSFCLY